MAMGGRGIRLTTAGGMPTGALYVYASMLIRLHLDYKPQRIAVAFDAPGKTFRDEIFADYKKTRTEPPDDLKVQMPYFRPLTEAFAWPVIAIPGVEADDIIATLVRQARERDWDVTIFAADKDLMCLVDDHVTMYDSMLKRDFGVAGVTEKFGVRPDQMTDWLSLVGDTSDNIPGMPGVGKGWATKLLDKYGSIDGILANIGELKGKMKERWEDPENLERLELSRKLVTLRDDVELPVPLDEMVPRDWDDTGLADLFEELEFGVLLERLGPSLAVDDRAEPAEALEPAQVITDAAEVAELVAAARAAGRYGLEVIGDGARHDRAVAIGVGLAVEGWAPGYIPLRHRYLGAPGQLDWQALAPLAALLGDPSVACVCHDLKSATKLLVRDGVALAPAADDTLVGAYLMDASRTDYQLTALAKDVLDLELIDQVQVCGKGKGANPIDTVAVESAATLVAHRAAAAPQLAARLKGRLERAKLTPLYRELELPLAALLARMEQVGIRIDTGYLAGLADTIGGEIAAIESRVYELAGEPINLGSPKQLSTLLFDKLALRSEIMKKRKHGYSTDHEVLEAMVDQHDIIRPIIEHRELIKLKGTYIDALPPLVNPDTGRLHTEFQQAVTATGRISSTEPNLQNIPIRTEVGRKIRRAFVAGERNKLVSADYSQIELRVLAQLSGDPTLRQAFAGGFDVHAQTAAMVFDVPLEAVGDQQRRVAKAVNYGLAYGQSDFGLSRALDVPISEARGYIEKYFERFAAVNGFMDRVIGEARKRGHATTIMGRRRPIPDLQSRNWRQRSAAERVAQNTPIQGSAADILKVAMLEVAAMLDESSFDAELLLTVHDELVFEVAEGQAEDLAARVKRVMEAAYPLEVPLVVDTGISGSWEGAH
jgi:DNA polymerase-1